MTERFPRVSRLRKGYSRKQVDAFLHEVDAAMAGLLPPVSAAEIRRVGFELARGGYDTVAVDTALDRLEEEVLRREAVAGSRRRRMDPSGEVEFIRAELTAPYMKRFPRAGALRRGYDVDDVDEFLDRVVAALEDGGADLAVEEVRSAPFRPRRGGYDEAAVDEALDRVVELLLVLRQQRPSAQRQGDVAST
jgi:DivIVA domain-containing protein